MDGDGEIFLGTHITGDVTWSLLFRTMGHMLVARAEGFKEVRGSSWGEVILDCKTQVSKSKTAVSVPFAYFYGRPSQTTDGASFTEVTILTATATGVHAGNGKVLVHYHDGRRSQVDFDYRRSAFRIPDKETSVRLMDVINTISVLESDRDAILKTLEFPSGTLKGYVRAMVEEARKAKLAEGGE